jgi:hypothetical protein
MSVYYVTDAAAKLLACPPPHAFHGGDVDPESEFAMRAEAHQAQRECVGLCCARHRRRDEAK